MPEGKWRQFGSEMEAKRVITAPSGTMRVQPDPLEIQGSAWSGNGTVRAVDVTTNGGRTWREVRLEGPVMDKCLTRFRLPWRCDGTPTTIASRAVGSTGYVQPTVAVMDRATLPQVRMPNRDGFVADDRPDTRAARCMTDCRPIGARP